jgi:hypothetical protein
MHFGLYLILLLMSQGYESQPFTVVQKYENFEVRFYPSVAMVETESSPGSTQNFRKLFQYLSGANETRLKIAMTTPVHMEQTEGKEKMAFVLPRNLEQPPNPQNESLKIIQSKEGYFAAIPYGGYSNPSKVQYYTQLLLQALNKNNIRPIGNAVELGYNSPYKFFNRQNEIIIAVAY